MLKTKGEADAFLSKHIGHGNAIWFTAVIESPPDMVSGRMLRLNWPGDGALIVEPFNAPTV
jgi:hypothetical protein